MTPTRRRECLALLRWTQRGFAAVIGWDEGTVRRWLSGALAVPQWVPLALAGLKRLQEATQSPLPHQG